MMRQMDVQVTLLNGQSKAAQKCVTVSALDPGAACAKAYPVVRNEFSGQEMPKVTAVHFLVRVSKGENPS